MDERRAVLIAESLDCLSRLDAALEHWLHGTSGAEHWNEARESVRAIHRRCAAANLDGPQGLLRPLHAIVHGIQEESVVAEEAICELLPEAVTELRNWLETLEATGEDPQQTPAALIERLERLAEPVGLEEIKDPVRKTSAIRKEDSPTSRLDPETDPGDDRFLRVPTDSLDELLNLLGRLSEDGSPAQQGTISDLQQCVLNMRVRPAETPSASDGGRCDIGPDNPEGVPCTRPPTRRVLVVGDSIFGRQLIAAMLETEGCETVVAENGDRAVEAVAAEDAPFDVVVLGIGGQTADTIDRIGTLRNRPETHGTPLLGVCLMDEALEEARLLRAGLDRGVAGLDARLLTDAIEDLCRQSRLRVGASA